jgi:coenzyme F420-0:L-glutamate ligase / coenzyme F420-1:gamma-L-glutamate ligase
MRAPKQLTLSAVPGIPLIAPGDDLGAIIIAAMENAGLEPRAGDIVVVAQKVVSKAQGRYVDLATIVPSARAEELAVKVGKDPRLVEVVLSESVRVVRHQPGVLIVEHRSGFVTANAGVDRSNVAPLPDGDMVLLLPADPDAWAASLRAELERHFEKSLGVVVSDSFGRPLRRGTVGVALGSAGIPALEDLRGRLDLFGRPLEVTESALADEIASAASLLMGQADEAQPVVLVSGFAVAERHIPARALIRPASEDLFR